MSDIDRSGPNEPAPAVSAGQSSESAPATQPGNSWPEEPQSDNPEPKGNLQDALPIFSKLSLQNERGIEEGYSVYRPGGFHPVQIGDIYNERYLVLSKLGYGLYSTVWLVRDTTSR